jgi:DNA-binding NarL/FixJ family response regulator
VFICDDALEHRALMRAVLADVPEVEIVGEAVDGATCLTGLSLTSPDLVLLDLQMPGTDGWHVLERLRQRSNPPRVLVVSSDRTAGDRVRAAGAEFLPKGASIEELRAAVVAQAA